MSGSDDVSAYVLFHNGVLHPPSKDIVEWVKMKEYTFVTPIFIGDNMDRKKWLLNNTKGVIIYPRNLPVLLIAVGQQKREVIPTADIKKKLQELVMD